VPESNEKVADEFLDLQQGRFHVEIDWRIPGFGQGTGKAGVGTDNAGGFWFTDRSDLNAFVKIKDGRAINGHFWLAYTSFTGAEYDLRVTDNETGLVRTYHNPLNQSTYGMDTYLDVDPNAAVVYPWISNSADYNSTLVINNHNCLPADVTLHAYRGNGDNETVERTIPPQGFLQETAADLFPDMGVGPGYAVTLTSSVPGVDGRWVTFNKLTDSPSQGVAIQIPANSEVPLPPNAGVGQGLSFGYLPLTGNFISAPVVVNVGDGPADISLYFYDKEGTLLASDHDAGRGLMPHRPLARLTSDLLPGLSDDVSLVAYSPDQPLAGVVFVFNTDGEPAIGNASGIDFAPPR